MDFTVFRDLVTKQMEVMSKHPLYLTNITKDDLWAAYLASFPEGTNPIYKERTEHDCNCCRQFIKACGNLVAIINGSMVSIWDIHTDCPTYGPVAKAMSALVKAQDIRDVMFYESRKVGTEVSRVMEDGVVTEWTHFAGELPAFAVCNRYDVASKQAAVRSLKGVFKRALDELRPEALVDVLDLIEQNNLYRGADYKHMLTTFQSVQQAYKLHTLEAEKDLFCWHGIHPQGGKIGAAVASIRNSAIGSLLVDLSEGVPLTDAVKSFEAKVAPANYKRTTALVTPAMITKAEEAVQELGYQSSLPRRFAKVTDVSINNVLFADRAARKLMQDVPNPFDALKAETSDNIKVPKNIPEVPITDFLENFLPKASSIEVLLENEHGGNLMSLLSPVDQDAPSMFKWGNNFSWAYKGDVTDSIKERVKAAGGNVTGDLRCSLSWFNHDDLDLHMIEPNGGHIYYSDKRSGATGGNLDVDMNAGGRTSRTPVENICYPSRQRMLEGTYKLYVNNFNKRESKDVGFEVEIEFDGKVYSFHYPQAVGAGRNVQVAEITYSKKAGFSVKERIPSSKSVREYWGLPTQSFHKVSMVLKSPNFWDDKRIGNEHTFFILDGCHNDEPARGFFNEFLDDRLTPHRKVFELLGSKMMAPVTDTQLSGLGFSATQRNSVVCKVSGEVNKVVRVTF